MSALKKLEELVFDGYVFEMSPTFMRDSNKINFVHIKLSRQFFQKGTIVSIISTYDNLNPYRFSNEEYIAGKLFRMENELKTNILDLHYGK